MWSARNVSTTVISSPMTAVQATRRQSASRRQTIRVALCKLNVRFHNERPMQLFGCFSTGSFSSEGMLMIAGIASGQLHVAGQPA